MDASIDDVRREMRRLLDEQSTRLDVQAEQITNLQAQITGLGGSFAEIVNLLDNSHPEWSTDAYTSLGVFPNDAGDENLEAYGWHRQPEADTELAESSANALKAEQTAEPAQHTLWAANEGTDDDIPRWNKPNGYFELGGVTDRYDIFIKIPNDVVFPGQRYYVQFEAMLRTADPLPDGLEVYAGLWDNTAGQRKWIEGGSFVITDDQGNDPGVTYGTPGSTSVDYQVVAYTDSGEEAISNILNFPNAPAVFDGANHPRIRLSGVPGFIRSKIYRKLGSSYVRPYTVGTAFESTSFEIGNPPQETVAGWPSITLTNPRARFLTAGFAPGAIDGVGWRHHTGTILVPTTYNRGLTGAGMQYLRLGLTGLTPDAPRQILFRRFGLSNGSSKWARSANDLRTGVHSSPSTSAAGSSAGSGDAFPFPPPPGPGGGGPTKIELIMPVE